MGLYINPRGVTKETWLKEKGDLLHYAPKAHKEGTKLAVCLVSNLAFSAAAVAFRQEELEALSDPTDTRHKFWFFVEEADIREICGDEANVYLGEAQ